MTHLFWSRGTNPIASGLAPVIWRFFFSSGMEFFLYPLTVLWLLRLTLFLPAPLISPPLTTPAIVAPVSPLPLAVLRVTVVSYSFIDSILRLFVVLKYLFRCPTKFVDDLVGDGLPHSTRPTLVSCQTGTFLRFLWVRWLSVVAKRAFVIRYPLLPLKRHLLIVLEACRLSIPCWHSVSGACSHWHLSFCPGLARTAVPWILFSHEPVVGSTTRQVSNLQW